MVLATTNLTGKVDSALLDRADIKAFVGLPSHHARYEILRSCLQARAPCAGRSSAFSSLRRIDNLPILQAFQ